MSFGIKPSQNTLPSKLITDTSFIDVVNDRANILHRFQRETMGVIKVLVGVLDYYDKSEKEYRYEDRAITFFMVNDRADELYKEVWAAEGDMN